MSEAHAVITGGRGDLAQAMLREFSARGIRTDAPGRDQLDVADPSSIRTYFGRRRVDLLVCNAGITRDHLLARLTEADWDEVWKVNYRGALLCAEAVHEAMSQQGGGSIVFVSSFSAKHPPLGQNAYATAKAALLGLTSDLSVRYGASNIRVNAVLPGFLETRMTAGLSAERRNQVLAHHTLGRFNTCEVAAKFVRFLHQDMPQASGQHFHLDSRLDTW